MDKTWHYLKKLASRALVVGAAYYVGSAFMTLANFGWRFPVFDQFRLYQIYLSLPFPANALQVENGHRPVLPALIRIFEVACCGASQTIQLMIGSAFAFTSAAILAGSGFRDQYASLWQKSAIVLASAYGIFWLANARIFLHGNESVQVYIVFLLGITASWLAWRSALEGRLTAMVGACLLATAATFSFTPGVVVFASAFIVALMSRAKLRILLIPVIWAVGILLLYLYVLPGEGTVRNAVHVDPLRNLATALAWLGSPLVHAWLGLAPDGAVTPWLAPVVAGSSSLGRLLASTAEFVIPSGAAAFPTIRVAAGLFGSLGVVLWLYVIASVWYRGPKPSVGLAVSVGACALGVGTAVIISLARLTFFDTDPGQLFADRYLPWSSLFWACLPIAYILTLAHTKRQRGADATGVLVVCAAVVLLPTHAAWAGWGAAVYRLSEVGAVAANLGVTGPMFPDGLDASRETVIKTLRLMRERGFGPFREPPPVHLGDQLCVEAEAAPDALAAQSHGCWQDSWSGRQVLRFTSALKDRPPAGDWLIITNNRGQVRGLARYSFLTGQETRPRWLVPRKLGFEGLIIDHDPTDQYLLLSGAGASAAIIGALNVACVTDPANGDR